jgi:ribosomal protein S18 acetylase RimI-like enzyme
VTDAWLAELFSRGGALCCCWDDRGLTAMGCLTRRTGVFREVADLQKLMVHPRARGAGHGRLVCTALVERARRDGVETVRLGVRGNNVAAIALYASLGFVERGRFPNAVAVGVERYDDVWMALALGYPPGVMLRGSGPGGPGS